MSRASRRGVGAAADAARLLAPIAGGGVEETSAPPYAVAATNARRATAGRGSRCARRQTQSNISDPFAARATTLREAARRSSSSTTSPRPLPGGASRAVRVGVSTRSETSRAVRAAARAPRGSPAASVDATRPPAPAQPVVAAPSQTMGLADVIQPAASTAYDEEAEDYGLWATLACILAGAVFTFLFLAGGQERQEQTQSVRDAEDDDARTNLLRACTRVLSWEADSDDEQESRAFATALDDALKRARSVHDGLSTMPTPPSVNTWAQSELQLLAERDLEGSSAGLELGATALALATTRRDHWEACETIGDEGRAAAFVVAASENVHTSVLLLGTRCRPRMPCAGERGLLVVAAGALADETGAQHKPGSCLAFRQSATRVLRAAEGPVLCVLLRVPVSCEMLLPDVS